jgi:hypothetical protein
MTKCKFNHLVKLQPLWKDHFKMVTGQINSEDGNWVKLAKDLLQFCEWSDKSSLSVKKVHFLTNWMMDLLCEVSAVSPLLQKEWVLSDLSILWNSIIQTLFFHELPCKWRCSCTCIYSIIDCNENAFLPIGNSRYSFHAVWAEPLSHELHWNCTHITSHPPLILTHACVLSEFL